YLDALVGDENPSRTYCLLAKAKFAQNKLTEARYYGEQSTDPSCTKIKKDIAKKYNQMLEEGHRRLCTTHPELVREKVGKNFPEIMEELGLIAKERLLAIIGDYFASTTFLNRALDDFWINKQFSPLNRLEQPKKLAAFLNSGKENQVIFTPVV